MALIVCKECRGELSSKADFCPSCGFKIKKRSFIGSMFRWFFVYPIVVGIFAAVLIPSYKGFQEKSSSKVHKKQKIYKKKYVKTNRKQKIKYIIRKKNILHATISKRHLGGQVTVYYLDRKRGSYKIAQQCVKYFRKKYKSAYCFVFSSRADFIFANPNEGGLDRLCYKAAYGIAVSGSISPRIKNNTDIMKFEDCPSLRRKKKKS